MALHLQTVWRPLVGQKVILKIRDEVIDTGVVDAVTLDEKVLWLDREGNIPRRLFERRDGVEVWINYKWETQQSNRSAGISG